MEKLKILNSKQYNEIIKFINNYNGLAVDCDIDLVRMFNYVSENTLLSIIGTEKNFKLRAEYYKVVPLIPSLLQRYERIIASYPSNDKMLLMMSVPLDLPPVNFCRLILSEKYKSLPKSEIANMLKSPHTIPDDKLAANVRSCIMSDVQESPLTNTVCRLIGEEYERKLKDMVSGVGMSFLDEKDLRRIGFDKTPDVKLALPCLYKGTIVNWIESKALFGSMKTHKMYLRDQLSSYTNRFGPGIVIYWFGYLVDIISLAENGDGLIILSDFPNKEDLEFLKL